MTKWSIEYAFGLIRNSLKYYFYNLFLERNLIFNNLLYFLFLGFWRSCSKTLIVFFAADFIFTKWSHFSFFLPSEWSRDPNLAG